MNIILFLNRDLESNLAFNLLQPELKGHDVRIYLSQTVGGKNKKVDELNILEYYEKELFYQLPHHLKEVGIQTSFEFLDDDFHLFPLSICEKVIQQHRGKIWVESTEGKGSIFHFTLPDD